MEHFQTDVTCVSLIPDDLKTINNDTNKVKPARNQANGKIYLDGHAIGNDRTSSLDSVLLSGVFFKDRPFLERLSYEITSSQFSITYLWKLPHHNVSRIDFELLYPEKQYTLMENLVARYTCFGKDFVYSSSYKGVPKEQIRMGSDIRHIKCASNSNVKIFRKVGETGSLFLVNLTSESEILNVDLKNSDLPDFYNPQSKEDRTPIISANTYVKTETINDQPPFIVTYENKVVWAILKKDFNAEKYYLLIKHELNTENLKVYDADFVVIPKEVPEQADKVVSVLLTTDGTAYFLDETFKKTYLKISSLNKKRFKLTIRKEYCFLYTQDEIHVVNVKTFERARLHLTIVPLFIKGNENGVYILSTNAKIYSFEIKEKLQPVMRIDRFKFKYGLPIRILPLHSTGTKSLVISQYMGDKNGKNGVTLSLFDNETMEVKESQVLTNVSTVRNVLIEPMLTTDCPEASIWKDHYIITLKETPLANKWYLVKVKRGKTISVVTSGSLFRVATDISINICGDGYNANVDMISNTGKDTISLFNNRSVTHQRESSTNSVDDVINVGGFYQDGEAQLINPFDGLYRSQNYDTFSNWKSIKEYSKKDLFGKGLIIKSAFKVYDPLKELKYNVFIKENLATVESMHSRKVDGSEKLLLSTEFNERKDFQRTYCILLDTENYIYLYDSTPVDLPQSHSTTKPLLKFKPKSRIINVSPVLQHFENSMFTDAKDGTGTNIPLFFLLGENGKVYMLSISENHKISREASSRYIPSDIIECEDIAMSYFKTDFDHFTYHIKMVPSNQK